MSVLQEGKAHCILRCVQPSDATPGKGPSEGPPRPIPLWPVLSAPEDLGWYPNGHGQGARGPEAHMGHTAGPLLAHNQPGRYLPLE